MAQTAIVGEKVGMTQRWVDDRIVPVTVLRVDPMRVVQIKTTERDGYTASHGNHKHHRAPGSIGACSFPGRVFKGLKMSGHMGHEQVTTLNLQVVDSDAERGLLVVKGSVPGPNGGVVHVRSAVKAAVKGS
jgi:ribosomal protein L3